MINYSNFEWYYFDLHSDEGYDIVCTIHPKPFNSIFDISIFDIFVYKDNKTLLHHFFVKNAQEKQKAESPFVIKYDDDNYIKKSNDLIEVSIIDETVKFKLIFKDVLKVKNPPVNELIQKNSKKSLFNWIVYAPLCEGNVNISWQDNLLEISGAGYHDYNSGTANLKQVLEKWIWAKYYFDNELFVYGEILARNGQEKKIALSVSNDNYSIIENPVKEIRDRKVYFHIPQRKFVFDMQADEIIDDVSFYMSILSGFTFYAKIKEAFYHLCSKYSINFLSKHIANVRYIRSRAVGKNQKNKTVTCFSEKMLF